MRRARARPGLFAVCIDNVDYPASLESRKLYEIVPDDQAVSHRQLRVIDESGEDLHLSRALLPSGFSASITRARSPSPTRAPRREAASHETGNHSVRVNRSAKCSRRATGRRGGGVLGAGAAGRTGGPGDSPVGGVGRRASPTGNTYRLAASFSQVSEPPHVTQVIPR